VATVVLAGAGHSFADSGGFGDLDPEIMICVILDGFLMVKSFDDGLTFSGCKINCFGVTVDTLVEIWPKEM